MEPWHSTIALGRSHLLGHSWATVRSLVEPFPDHFRSYSFVMCGPLLDHIWATFGSRVGHFGVMLIMSGHFWGRPILGHARGTFCVIVGSLLGHCWVTSGSLFGSRLPCAPVRIAPNYRIASTRCSHDASKREKRRFVLHREMFSCTVNEPPSQRPQRLLWLAHGPTWRR